MDLVNKQVTHKRFGKGSVVDHSDSYIEVHFVSGNKRFVYPDAFGTYLSLTDSRTASSVQKVLEKREEERRIEEIELENKKTQLFEERQLALEREKLLKNLKIHPSSQCAFWCDEQDCKKVFDEWRVFAGVIKSGSKKGMPNRLARVNQNSACILTVRDPGMQEKDRRIIGMFMVGENFVGKLCDDGYVPAHSEYRLQLSEKESKEMLFWNYYSNQKYPESITWNAGRYRYFDNIWMAQILRDIVSLKSKGSDRELAQRFYEHFCSINNIEEKELAKPNGALLRV